MAGDTNQENIMGDRANIHVKSENYEGVYFYTHWEGDRLPQTLQRALARKLRWDDEQYLNRIIFCEMVGKDMAGETGYGITSYLCDNNHEIIEVDVDGQTITIGNEVWTFDEFIKADLSGLEY